MFIAFKNKILTHKYQLQVLRLVFYKQKLGEKFIFFLCNFLNISDVEINIETEVKNTKSIINTCET
jgi:hypothetical protein